MHAWLVAAAAAAAAAGVVGVVGVVVVVVVGVVVFGFLPETVGSRCPDPWQAVQTRAM